jgi:hypothetical protein
MSASQSYSIADAWNVSREPFAARARYTPTHERGWRNRMKKWIILLAGIAAMASFAPTPSMAQGVVVGVPGIGGVQIGEPDRPRYREYRRDREYGFREREVRSGRGCRTVTIERDDGTVRRIRRCD